MGTSLGTGIGIGLGGGRRAVSPRTIAGSKLALWLRADRGITGSSNVSTWADQSGNGRDFTQGTLSKRPDFTAAIIGGKPAIYFNGTSDILDGPSFATIAAIGSAEMHAVMLRAEDPPTALNGYGGTWRLGSPTATEDFYPNSADGKIYAGFMSSARKSTNVVKGAAYFEEPRIVSCLSAAGEWTMWLDGTQEYTTATNTVAGSTSAIGGAPETPGVRMYGWIAEVIIFAPVLTSGERAAVLDYLGGRYGITVP